MLAFLVYRPFEVDGKSHVTVLCRESGGVNDFKNPDGGHLSVRVKRDVICEKGVPGEHNFSGKELNGRIKILVRKLQQSKPIFRQKNKS